MEGSKFASAPLFFVRQGPRRSSAVEPVPMDLMDTAR